MPQTRYIKEFSNGVLTAEIPYEVSDEEVADEEAERKVIEISALPDIELTTAKLKQLVKALVALRR